METMEEPWVRTPPSQGVDSVSVTPSRMRMLTGACALADTPMATSNSNRGPNICPSVRGKNITAARSESLHGSSVRDQRLDPVGRVHLSDPPRAALLFEAHCLRLVAVLVDVLYQHRGLAAADLPGFGNGDSFDGRIGLLQVTAEVLFAGLANGLLNRGSHLAAIVSEVRADITCP